MRHQALSSPMQALYRVFVLPSLPQTTTRSLQKRISNATTGRTIDTSCRAIGIQKPMQSSAFSTSTRLAATRPPEKRSQLWDEEIPAFRVAVVDPATQKLNPPETLRYVLSRFDRKTHRLVCVTPPPSAAQRAAQEGEWIPTCRIVSKKEQYEQEKAKQKSKVQAKKNSADNVKTIELNWAIDGNDLGHRMRRVEEFLREGRRVEVVLAKRKGGRKATIEECEGVVDKILETVEAVEGAKQLKKMEGKLAGVATLFFEGPKKVVEKEKPGKAGQQQQQSSDRKETQAEA